MSGIGAVRQRLTAVVAGLAFGLAAIVAPATAQMGEQVTLDVAAVEGFIASFPVVKATAEKLEAQYGDPTGGATDPSSWGAWMAVGGALGELNGAVQQHGFSDFQQWTQVMISVAMAYTFAKEGGNMDQGMADALQQIQNNPNLTAEQKQMMLQQLQASMGAVSAMRPPPGNVEAVTPYLDQIATVLDDN